MSAIRDILLDPTMLESDLPEYVGLLRSHVATLDAADQRRLIEMIESRPAPATYSDGSPIDPEEGHRWLQHWQLRLLAAMGDAVPADVQERFPDLERYRSEPVLSDEELVRMTGWVGDRGAIDTDAILAMSVDDLLSHLREWKPSRTFLDGPTIEGQADALADAVAREAARFADRAPDFIAVDPTYVRALVRGLTTATKEDRAFEWVPVFALAQLVLSQKSEPPRGESSAGDFDRDPGWSWTRGALIELVRAALDPKFDFAIAHRDATWKIIEVLAEDPTAGGLVGPTADRDALTASLNRTSAEALHAAVEYLTWIHRQVAPTSRTAMAIAPEVADLLDRHIRHDRSVASRGAIGYHFGRLVGLDADWTNERVSAFFPPEDEPVAATTWQAYVGWNGPRDDIVRRHQQLYVAAARRLPAEPLDTHRPDVGEALARHLAIAYLRGVLELKSDALVEFYRWASARLRGYLIEDVGRLFEASAELDAVHCDRAQALWLSRVSAAAAPTGGQREELEQFGWWFTSGKCNETWMLEQLVEITERVGSIEPDLRVLEKLEQLAAAHPVESIRCVEALIRAPKERWFLDMHRGTIQKIVRSAIASDAARSRARSLAQRLVTIGLLEFEELAR